MDIWWLCSHYRPPRRSSINARRSRCPSWNTTRSIPTVRSSVSVVSAPAPSAVPESSYVVALFFVSSNTYMFVRWLSTRIVNTAASVVWLTPSSPARSPPSSKFVPSWRCCSFFCRCCAYMQLKSNTTCCNKANAFGFEEKMRILWLLLSLDNCVAQGYSTVCSTSVI